MKKKSLTMAVLASLQVTTMLAATAAYAQSTAPSPTSGAAVAKDQKSDAVERIVVTGSRVAKQDFDSNSPIITITAAELSKHQDVTLETFLNTLPQVNPASTTSSNNPGNSGQANIDLRGLGANRNLVLVDGRRTMVSGVDQSVDLNTIPLSLVESIEIISGGAGAVYGADAVAGVVNIKLKRRFEGAELRAGWSDSERFKDSRERNASVLMGGNFANDRGNAVLSFEFSQREQLIKSQRPFAAIATATTSFFPEGTYRPAGTNLPSQAAVDALYGHAAYGGSAPGAVPNSAFHSFNSDGSLFYPGVFNSPRNVTNFRYPVDLAVNTRLFPDVYSYNFDAVNLLILPLERKSVMGKVDYRFGNGIEANGLFSNTSYFSDTALAPSPVSTVVVASSSSVTSAQGSSALISPGRDVGAVLVVPVTNPFIPADLRTLLASRTGDDPRLVGSGATEPFLMRWRTLALGLRKQLFENDVTQYQGGLKGPLFGSNWRWEVQASEGRTVITSTQTGNVDTNRLLATLAAPDGGASLCTGGVNVFGRQPLSAACRAYLSVTGTQRTEFTQTIGQAFVSGEMFQMPAGGASAVLGLESRDFKFTFDPGAAAGPISGFAVQDPAGGSNRFRDVFAEATLPIARDRPLMRSLELHFAYRTSISESLDSVKAVKSEANRSNSWAMDFSWEPSDALRVRGSAQKAVRAANFSELFAGGGVAPEIFDPCSITSTARTSGGNAARLGTLCRDAGLAGGLGAANTSFVATPGNQTAINTEGNPRLKPETGNTVTLGLVWAPRNSNFRASMDYYSIKIKDAITGSDVNEFIADCYNYYGRNASYNPAYANCQAIFRANDIIQVLDLTTDSNSFPALNSGSIKTQGIDVQLDWGNRVGPGRLDLSLHMSYLLSYTARTQPQFPEFEFAGTIPYFGTALGQAFPKLKANLTGKYQWNSFTFDARARFIDKMSNRMGQLYPGEAFTGVPATTYWDLGVGYAFSKIMNFRVGVINALDQKPRLYSPNQQSGTDPSTYDVVGRKLLAQATFKF